MELWIRSQDKEVLLKCNQVYYFTINNKHIIGTDLELVQRGYDYQSLGYYKSKERALEVLNEIENKIKYMGKTYEIGTMQDERLIPHKHNYVDNVYEMPQE